MYHKHALGIGRAPPAVFSLHMQRKDGTPAKPDRALSMYMLLSIEIAPCPTVRCAIWSMPLRTVRHGNAQRLHYNMRTVPQQLGNIWLQSVQLQRSFGRYMHDIGRRLLTGTPICNAERLEQCLQCMMAIVRMMDGKVHGHFGTNANGTEKFLDEGGIKVKNMRLRQNGGIDAVGAIAQVKGHLCKSVIHGDDGVSEACHGGKRLVQFSHRLA